MRQPACRRNLVFVLLLIAPTMGCEIRSRLGASPTDAAPADGPPADAARSPDNASPLDGPTPSQDLAPADVGTAPDGGAGDGSHGGGTADGAIDQAVVVLACVPNSTPQVPEAPLRRLTNFEYDNTVRDLLGETSRPATSLLPFDGYLGFPNDISNVAVDRYRQIAHDLALKVTKDAAAIKTVTNCDLSSEGEAACQKKFIDAFLPVAFRRPLDATETSDFGVVFAKGRELTGDFAGGVRAVVEVALQSPEFLYRVEFGQPVEPALPGVARLSPHETATRLSYLLWGSAPDPMLRSAAAEGRLQTKEQIATQARRLVAEARAREVVRYFYLQLLQLNSPGMLDDLVSPDISPPFTAQMTAALLGATSAFIDEVTWQGAGDFQSLMTAPFTFMNGPLAAFYGVSGVTGEAFQKVPLDPSQRAGILMQASVLAEGSHPSGPSPVFRGKLIFERILCGTLPSPPADVAVPPPVVVPDPNTLTTRQKFALHLTEPTCIACHKNIDDLGFAFDHFDRFGRWRDTENGLAIDTTGEIHQTDAKGKFAGPIDLIARLVQSRDVQNCYVGNWMRLGYGRPAASQDACSVQFLRDAFTQSKGNVRELLVSLTQTDAFLYKSAP